MCVNVPICEYMYPFIVGLICTDWTGSEKFIIRQPTTGGKDDYDSENSWIPDGLPSSSRNRQCVRELRQRISANSNVSSSSSLLSTSKQRQDKKSNVSNIQFSLINSL